MSDQIEAGGDVEAMSSPGPSGGTGELFFEIWLKALTRPSEETYQAIVSAPNATVARAALWLFFGTLFGSGVAAVFQIGRLSRILSELGDAGELAPFAGMGAAFLLCLVPFQAGVQVVWTLVYTAILQFVAGAFGGTGRYRELFFGLVSFTAPLTMATGLLASIPLAGACLTVPISIYLLYLNALVIKAVHRIGWGGAVVTLLVPVIVSLLLLVIIILAFFVPLFAELMQNGAPTF